MVSLDDNLKKLTKPIYTFIPFRGGQFFINSFSAPFRLDRNKNSGGIMLLIREDIPATLKSIENTPIEAHN